jgi:hypothetical protein
MFPPDAGNASAKLERRPARAAECASHGAQLRRENALLRPAAEITGA